MITEHRWTPEFIADATARAAKFLGAQPGVTRVWLFGSAAKGRRMSFRSDLDFAVEGLLMEQHFAVWSELERIVDCPAELVRWEEAGDTLRTEILKWGKLLHEA